MSETLFRVGILGATGYIGTPYRAEIRGCKDARIVALCARRKDLLETAAREDGASCITQEWQEVVGHPEVNMVIVATPDALHHEAVMACARQGKHLLCEKPVAMNTGQAREMWKAYQEHPDGLAHYVPFWTRMVDVFRLSRECVASGELGTIRSVIFRWQNPRPEHMPLTWRDDPALSSAGTIADVGSHAYDAVRWIMGNTAEKVFTHGETLTPGKQDLGCINLTEAIAAGNRESTGKALIQKGGNFDYACVNCRFENGAAGVFILSHATYMRKFLAPELELHGTKASLSADRYTGKLILARPGHEPETLHKLPAFEFGNRFEAHVFPSMAPQVRGETSAVKHPTLEDGWLAQRFTDAAYQSGKQGDWVDV
ncbi:MAG: Gfo/Idh/MocA family oxidoreductase [Verrucomicrobiota bacterium]|nr:Gfo/Idh/MocA family oxidoreductase [Verrucomicrobiota bacterium]